MQIIMTTSIVGNFTCLTQGQIYDLPTDRAQELIDIGKAEPVQSAPPVAAGRKSPGTTKSKE